MPAAAPMKPRLSDRLATGLPTLLVWALVAASALFWYLRTSGGGAPVATPLAGGTAVRAPADARQVARALGVPDNAAAPAAVASEPALASRLALRGIVTHGGRGAALIAVDGKPPKPVRIGAPLEGVEGGWAVRSLTPRAVVLAAGDQQLRLEMPGLAERSSAGDAVAPSRPGAPTVTPPAPPTRAPPRPAIVPGAAPVPQVFPAQPAGTAND